MAFATSSLPVPDSPPIRDRQVGVDHLLQLTEKLTITGLAPMIPKRPDVSSGSARVRRNPALPQAWPMLIASRCGSIGSVWKS